MANTKALPNGLELRDTCTPWHCAGAARQGKCAAQASGPLGTRPVFCAGKCPAARATVALFSHILAGKPRSIFPDTGRVSRRPNTPGAARHTVPAPSRCSSPHPVRPLRGCVARPRALPPGHRVGAARRTLRVRKRGRDGLPKDTPARYRRCWVGTMCGVAQVSGCPSRRHTWASVLAPSPHPLAPPARAGVRCGACVQGCTELVGGTECGSNKGKGGGNIL
jgi:hypothetical protein